MVFGKPLQGASVIQLRFQLLTQLLLLCLVDRVAAAGTSVAGVVLDSRQAAVASAQVRLLDARAEIAATSTDKQGRFALTLPEKTLPENAGGLRDLSLQVTARGFAPQTISLASVNLSNITVELAVEGVNQAITVAAARTELPIGEAPASVVEIPRATLDHTAALAFDDVLRQAAGFDLFRRSSSRNANPTTEGVTLRGLGANGSSRALVMQDGIPLSDPFGGWVNWAQLPALGVENVEIVRGGASDLYGSDALGGVINLTSRSPQQTALDADLSYGNEQTGNGSVFASMKLGPWGTSFAGDYFRTDGFVIVDPSQRGVVDTAASSQHKNGAFEVERVAQALRFFGKLSGYDDDRHNGTPLTVNRTRFWEASTGIDYDAKEYGLLQGRVYGGPQGFHQSFSSVNANRTGETLTNVQDVPAYEWGASGQWTHNLPGSQTLVAGVDGRESKGDSNEFNYSPTRAVTRKDSGALTHDLGAYMEDIVQLPYRFRLTGALRFDRWWNIKGFSRTQAVTAHGPLITTGVPSAFEDAIDPKLALSRRINDSLSITASAYRSFRSPTLNELYRSFRVGNVVTQANNKLMAERLTGWEVGAVQTMGSRVRLQGTFFWDDVYRPIANLTLSTTPTLITRQRTNLGTLRARGLEIQADTKVTNQITVSAGYQYADSIVLHAPAAPALAGLWVPEVPRHEFTFQAQYSNPSILTFGTQGRALSSAFDDDLNTLVLDPYFKLDFFASRRLGPRAEAYVAAENILDQTYQVARTPNITIGPPVLVRVGVRLHLAR